jgi:hypothetical protein
MATHKRNEANRRKVVKATGETTAKGQNIMRLTPVRENAGDVVMAGESREEFQRLCDELEGEWQPQNRAEQRLVERLALFHWTLQRMAQVEMSLDCIEAASLRAFERLEQYRNQLERAYHEALDELWRLRREREREFARRAKGRPIGTTGGKPWVN